MNAPDHWQSLTPAKRMEMEKHARSLVRGSIIEDAASRFMAMCMAEAIGESTRRADLAPAAPKVKALVEAVADYLFWKTKCDADDHENAIDTVLIEAHMEDAEKLMRAALAALEGGDA